MHEQAVFLGSSSEVFGVYHDTIEHSDCRTAFIFLNAGLIHRPGPFRLYTELARALSHIGFSSIRIDQCGKGDSPRRAGMGAIDSAKLDFNAAADFLEKRGAKRIIAAGLCSGADDSFWIAKDSPRVAGVVMLDGYAPKNKQFYRKKFSKKISRVTPKKVLSKIWSKVFTKRNQDDVDSLGNLRNFPEDEEGVKLFEEFISRKLQCLFVYTGDIGNYYNYLGQLEDCVNNSDFNQYIKEVFFPEAKHTYPFVADRAKLVNTVCEWAKSLPYESLDSLANESANHTVE